MESKDAGFWALVFTAATISVFILVLLDLAFPEEARVVKDAVTGSAARGWDATSHGALRAWDAAMTRVGRA